MDQRIKIFAGVALTIGSIYLVSVYRDHAQNNYSATVVRDIPRIPFEKGRPLSGDEKQSALDLTVASNRMLLAAGLLDGDYAKETFSSAYFATMNPGVAAPNDTFEKRDRARRALVDGAAGYTKAKAEWAKKPIELTVLPVKISFMHYQFKTQAFGVEVSLLSDSRNEDAFGVSAFRDIPVPKLIPGSGSSAFERSSSGKSAYQVTTRLWSVPEGKAKNVDTERFRVYANGYFDTSASSTDGRMTMLHCIQVDLFADDQRTIPLGSQGCASLNVTRKW